MSRQSAIIVGLSGTELQAAERAFLAEVRPAGIILFKRNLDSHEQIERLVAEARDAIGMDALVLIDQEGGRVQRLRPPLGRALPPASAYARYFEESPDQAVGAVRLAARLLADDLRALGIDTNCAPVLDVPVRGAHEIIGDRAYGRDPMQVARLGRAVAEGLMAGGVVPVVKHIPGHGRATADSHLALPVVTASFEELACSDFAAFTPLADMPAAMTAHVVFNALDGERPASISPVVTRRIVRGLIGFGGLLMSDDLGMHALSGSMRERAEAVIGAGSDIVLHCSGDLAEMRSAAAGVPELSGPRRDRFEAALAVRSRRDDYDRDAAEAALAEVLGRHVAGVEVAGVESV